MLGSRAPSASQSDQHGAVVEEVAGLLAGVIDPHRDREAP
jgi:hypothetical protein